MEGSSGGTLTVYDEAALCSSAFKYVTLIASNPAVPDFFAYLQAKKVGTARFEAMSPC